MDMMKVVALLLTATDGQWIGDRNTGTHTGLRQAPHHARAEKETPMNVLTVMELAEIRHAELLEQAERLRLAQRAASRQSGSRRWGRVWRGAVVALRARDHTTRPDLTKPADLALAAETT
jgi:hypothetical protein